MILPDAYTTIEYDPTTGRLLRYAAGMVKQEHAESVYPDSDQAILIYVGPTTIHHQFVYIDLTDPDNPTPTERPPSPVTLTDLTLQHLPVGGDLFIDGTRYEITDETVELAFPLPGTYALRVESFPFLDWTGSVTV
jgi:hypothetical protein